MKPLKILLIFLLLMVAVSRQLNAEINWEAGMNIGTFFDDNMSLDDDRYIDDDAIYALSVSPEIKFAWLSGQHAYNAHLRYRQEFYIDNNDDYLKDSDSFTMTSNWTWQMSDSLTFIFSDNLKLSEFGTRYIDHPISRQDYLEYSSNTGLLWSVTDQLRIKTDLIWGLMAFESFRPDDILSLHGKDWDDLGVHCCIEYSAIPEMNFFVEYSWKKREFTDNPEMPELTEAKGNFGFRSLLPSDTEVTLKGCLYHVDYDGIPPRRTESNYNNYGAELSVKQAIKGMGHVFLDAFSRYELSHKLVRMFYRDSGLRLSGEINIDPMTQITAWLQYDELKYFGMESEEGITIINTGVTAERQLHQYISISGTYRYYDRENDWDLIRSSNRFTVTVSLILPEF